MHVLSSYLKHWIGLGVVVFNTTFNISVISCIWQSVLLVEKVIAYLYVALFLLNKKVYFLIKGKTYLLLSEFYM